MGRRQAPGAHARSTTDRKQQAYKKCGQQDNQTFLKFLLFFLMELAFLA